MTPTPNTAHQSMASATSPAASARRRSNPGKTAGNSAGKSAGGTGAGRVRQPPTESLTTSSPLELATSNRARIVLSLLDQRADLPLGETLSHPHVAEALHDTNPHAAQTYSSVSRMVRGHRRWQPDHVLALCQWARRAYGLLVDPGWVMFGSESGAPAPEIPADCRLREMTTTDGLPISHRTLRVIRAAEKARAKGR